MIQSFEEYMSSQGCLGLLSRGLTESKSESTDDKPKTGCNIIFVTKNPHNDNSHGEYSRFKKSADKYGVNIYPVDVDNIKYKLNEDNTLQIDDVGVFSKKNTIFMFRHAVKIKSTDEEKQVTQTNVKNFKSLLKANGFLISNDASVAGICKNKAKTFEILKQKGVDTIDTFIIDRQQHDSKKLEATDNMNKFLTENNLQLPVVVKVVDGSQGLGVFKCQDLNILTSVVQYLVRTKGKCIIQPFCEINYDVRMHVFCKTLKPAGASEKDFIIIGSMKREKADGDFRTNYSIGGHISNYIPSPEEKTLAKKAAAAIGSVWCGVDICYDNISGRNYVIEINSSPALKGISQVTDKAPTDLIVKHIKKTLSEGGEIEQDIEDRDLVSYYEMVNLDGIPIKGCFDTGNSCMCAIKTDHFKEKDGELEFKLNDQIVTKKIVRRKSILHGGVKSDKRPVVLFDISFDGKTLKDVEVCVRDLTDIEKERQKLTKKKVGNRILLSTEVIDKLNLIVHPDRNIKFTKGKGKKKDK
jgi:glutathione synthase/RimK-type ligase-like ATP-grasp enzyme